MCGFLSKDLSHVPGAYSSGEQPLQSRYEHPQAYSPSPSPHQRIPAYPEQRDGAGRCTPPQNHALASPTALGHALHGSAGEDAQTERAFSQSSPSSSSDKARRHSDAESPRSRASMIRMPCSVISQLNGSATGAAGQGAHAAGSPDDPEQLSEALKSIVELKEFLASAPTQFGPGEFIRQFRLPSEEQISCVRWRQVFCITGTDIVRSLVFRFSVFGREVTNRKKFEEGVFSDLRNLKINVDATLESPKSELLELLYKHHCVRTKKKQKVFFWYSVQHDQLFIDTLERELKREQAYKAEQHARSLGMNGYDDPYMCSGSPASTRAVREPALSFEFNSAIPLVDQVASISKGLPPNFATLIDATTTGLSTSDGQARSTLPNAARAMPIPGPRSGRQNNLHNSHSHDYEYAYPPHPLTPTPSLDKVSSHDLLLSPRFHARQQAAFATPDSLASMPTPTSITPLAASSTRSPWGQSSSYGSQNSLSLESSSSAAAAAAAGGGGCASILRGGDSAKLDAEESDFPLDLLVQHDYDHQKPLEETSFHNKYHDFVYNNRPALSSSSSLAPSPFSPAGPGLTFAGTEWGHAGAGADAAHFSEDSHPVSYQQHFAPMWRRPINQRSTPFDPPFDYKGAHGSGAGRRGSGRISKYTNPHIGTSSVSGGAFTDSY